MLERVNKQCPTCSAIFIVRITTNRKYCSNKCVVRIKPPNTKCLHCDKPFRASPHRFRSGRGKYCSRSCFSRSEKKSQDGIAAARKLHKRGYPKGPLLQAFKKGHTPWNKGIANCWSDEILQKIKDARAKQVFLNSNTSIELKIKEQLDKYEIQYEHPFPLWRFICDFRIKNTNIIIECDGDYFHSLPRNRRYDYMKNKYCKENGWRIIRLTEKQINNNIDECMNIVKGVMF